MLSSTSSPERTRRYRERMRQQGLRRIELWVPDVDSPEFIAEARRQSRIIAETPFAEEDQAFIDAISEDLWK